MAAICKKGKTFTNGCTTNDSNSKHTLFQDICYTWKKKKQVIILKQLETEIQSEKRKKRERTPLQQRPAANWQRDTGETFPLLRSNLVGPNSNRCTVHCTVEQRFLLATLTLDKSEEYNVAMTVVGGKSKSRCKLIPSLHLAALRCANAALVAVISSFLHFQCHTIGRDSVSFLPQYFYLYTYLCIVPVWFHHFHWPFRSFCILPGCVIRELCILLNKCWKN